MTYRIKALPVEPFQPLFDLSDAELAAVGARRWTATHAGLAPCRVSLQDADAGERLILPHPRMLLRSFVLAPLAEIAPGKRIGGTTIQENLALVGHEPGMKQLGPLKG